MPVTIKAKLFYDPSNLNGETRKGFQFWWAAAMLSSQLTEYYRHLYFLQCGGHLTAPMWRAHVSVIRGEEPKNKGAWKKYHNKEFNITYFPEAAKGSDTYLWFPAESAELEEVREELGLRRQPKVNFHLTIGNRKGNEPRKVQIPFKVFPWENTRMVEQSWRFGAKSS